VDPVTLATVTAALTVLGSEVGSGIAKEAGKDLWSKAKSLLGLKKEPEQADLASTIAERLSGDEDLMKSLVELLQQTQPVERVSALVQNVNAEKLVIIKDQTVNGDFNLNL
jgi:hypothetical protein